VSRWERGKSIAWRTINPSSKALKVFQKFFETKWLRARVLGTVRFEF
jgi:hypothetical protein